MITSAASWGTVKLFWKENAGKMTQNFAAKRQVKFELVILWQSQVSALQRCMGYLNSSKFCLNEMIA